MAGFCVDYFFGRLFGCYFGGCFDQFRRDRFRQSSWQFFGGDFGWRVVRFDLSQVDFGGRAEIVYRLRRDGLRKNGEGIVEIDFVVCANFGGTRARGGAGGVGLGGEGREHFFFDVLECE